jgi:hypothetical protein
MQDVAKAATPPPTNSNEVDLSKEVENGNEKAVENGNEGAKGKGGAKCKGGEKEVQAV